MYSDTLAILIGAIETQRLVRNIDGQLVLLSEGPNSGVSCKVCFLFRFKLVSPKLTFAFRMDHSLRVDLQHYW